MVVRRVVKSTVRRLVPVVAVLPATALALGLVAGRAEARSHHFYRPAYSPHVAHAARAAFGSVGPNFSAIVVDANTGRTLYAANEDAPRHPASITKVMTLYLLFEELQKGRISLDSPLQVSAHAAAQAPTKLGLRPGSVITVENAIKAIVTKSANDMAVAVAENLAGDEGTFAQLMTQKAHQLGMNHTFYHNASGLPDMRQITTARDLTVLGRSIHDRFPTYYRFFSTPSFTYAGSFMPNHNHLMARVTGMDGIKTGYTNASGFNLLSSVNRGGRHIVSVVLGGRTAASRDQIMESLIEGHIEEASATPTTHVAEGSPVEPAAETPRRFVPTPQPIERDPPQARPEIAQNDDDAPDAPVEARRARTRVEVAQSDDDAGDDGPVERHPARGPSLIAPEMAVPDVSRPAERLHVAARVELPKSPPLPVRAPDDKPRPAFIAGAPRSADLERPVGSSALAERATGVGDGSTNRRIVVASASAQAVATATPSSLRWVSGPAPARLGPSAPEARTTPAAKAPGISFAAPANERTGSVAEGAAKADETHPPVAKGEWVIQIGAPATPGAATELLARARSEGRSALASATPFTEKVQKGDTTLYRARFAGLDPSKAETACKTLKRSGFSCFATRN